MNDETSNGVDERIRAALHAAVDDLHERDLRPALPPHAVPKRHRTIRWAAPLLAAAAVVGVVVTSVAVSSGPQAAKHTVPAVGTRTPPPTPIRTPTTAPSQGPTTTQPPTKAPTTSTSLASPQGSNCFFDFGPGYICTLLAPHTQYQPLWPFGTHQAARHWQTVDGPAGHSAWHLDAKQTALSFVRDYLGFTDITTVTSTTTTLLFADIGVGYSLPNGSPHTAAVVRLLRYSPISGDPSAPWEVVGATSTDFSIGTIAVAQSLPAHVTVGGRITGVDENITVTLRTLAGYVQSLPGQPAGGDKQPWSVTADGVPGGVLTVVASTGGHVIAHERFVVTGISG